MSTKQSSNTSNKDREFILINIGYTSLVLDYHNGLKILESLEFCEIASNEYSPDEMKIRQPNPNEIRFSILNRDFYREVKTRTLLENRDE